MHKKQKPMLQARALAQYLGVGDKQTFDRLYLVAEAGYTTLQALKTATDADLLAIPGIGRAAVAQLRDVLRGAK